MFVSDFFESGPTNAKKSGHSHPPQRGELADQAGFVLDLRDRIEFRLDGREPELLRTLLIHERRVESVDLLRVGVALHLGRLFDDRADARFREIPQREERAIGGAVARDLGGLEPLAVHMAEEIVLHADGCIEIGFVDAGFERGLGGETRLARKRQGYHGCSNCHWRFPQCEFGVPSGLLYSRSEAKGS